MPLNYSFAGKSVLVTGGASGIGRQVVQRLVEDSATVFVIDKNAEAIAKLKVELPSIRAEVVDLADWDATKTAVESFGKLNHLVNNAGFNIAQTFLEITPEAAKLQYDVMILAIINVTQVFAKTLIASGDKGTLVNMSSIAGRKPFPQAACYGAVKSGVVALTKSIALELAQHGVRANCILPGFVETPLLQRHATQEMLQQVLPKMLENRVISPNEIADLVLFLLSPLSNMITGEEICIEGGLTLH